MHSIRWALPCTPPDTMTVGTHEVAFAKLLDERRRGTSGQTGYVHYLCARVVEVHLAGLVQLATVHAGDGAFQLIQDALVLLKTAGFVAVAPTVGS